MRIYGPLLRVPFHAIYDPWSGELDAYRFDSDHGQYEPLVKDERGYVRCEPLDLWLGVVPEYLAQYRARAPWLRWIDNGGQRLALPSERAARESERAARESERANAAEAELAALRAKIERKDA